MQTDRPPLRHVRRLTGELTSQNYERFSEIIFDEIDGVVGLDLMIAPTPDSVGVEAERFVAHQDDERLIVYKVTDQGGSEILINGALSLQWGMWRADGFYLVKSGGLHQGMCSVGLIATDEALIRLNPAVKVINIRLS